MEPIFVEATLTVVYSEDLQDPGQTRHDLTRLGLPHPKRSLKSTSLVPPRTVMLVWPTLERGSALHRNLLTKTKPSAIKPDMLDNLGISYIDYEEREILEHTETLARRSRHHPYKTRCKEPHSPQVRSPATLSSSGLKCVKDAESPIPTAASPLKSKSARPRNSVSSATHMNIPRSTEDIPSSTTPPPCDTHPSSGNTLRDIALKSQRLLALQKDLSRTLSRSRQNAPQTTDTASTVQEGSSSRPDDSSAALIQRLEERLEYSEQALSQERRRRIRAEEKLANILGKSN
ncbi:hypothetical protein PTI98_012818 [Pleurotus ostreatus]|nr:hypothetical protein PTI98_012818 [Pleurotus ostreatus]